LLAEDEGHHPDMTVGWGYVGVELTTHAAKGLTDNDFIVAAKIDRLTAGAGLKENS
jgi:4a-hydroxytetrahydrobiopterin dehydratase